MQLDPLQVKQIFDQALSQADYILGLMRILHPDFDQIQRLNANPVCSKDTWTRICEYAQAVDARINCSRSMLQQLLPGGAWMNYGFSARGGEELPLWGVIPVSETDIER